MRKTTQGSVNGSTITINTDGLMIILGCGRQTAVKIGTDAEAKVQIGKRVLWNLPKVQKYIDTISL